MPNLNLSSAQSSDMTNAVEDYAVEPMVTDGVSEQKETEWTDANWTKNWGYFNTIPDLKSAILMKAIWNVGKGWETIDPVTEATLDHITGWGFDTFDDILFNAEVVKRIGGNFYAEIIRAPDGQLLNLKPLDPGSMRHVVDRKGQLIRFEQINKTGKKGQGVITFRPDEIFYLANNRLADEIHGRSDIDAVEEVIKADEENFKDIKQIMHHQARPFILWKLKTDDKAKIAELVDKIDQARNLGEDMFIPDDDEAIEYEVVSLSVSSIIMEWRNDIRNKFYRTIGLPQIIPGAGGQGTESESKVIFTAFQNIVERDQRALEKQIWGQLGLKVNLVPPESLIKDLQADEGKDAQNALRVQPQEAQPGVVE
ncbi:MAG: hypothetical protein CMI54_04245 [Parcubacteria group bacterium]|nr:hypothetical protein [Parcubacteria group bacterium]|tara:strand:+ start:3205 stop:4308 length:1104 start_codon:yes stop_codon:yes gene_type:complete